MSEKKPRNRGDRSKEVARRKELRARDAVIRDLEKAESPEEIRKKKREIEAQLIMLAERTGQTVPDHEVDMQWAYTNMGNPKVMPLDAPTVTAWSWYEYARTEQAKFLEAWAKRGDARAKAAGTVTQQRMEDDKRQYFAILDRIERELSDNVDETINDLMTKFPTQVLRACKKHEAAWKEFLANEP